MRIIALAAVGFAISVIPGLAFGSAEKLLTGGHFRMGSLIEREGSAQENRSAVQFTCDGPAWNDWAKQTPDSGSA